MKLDDLSRKGVPARIIERWRQRQGEQLLPVQSRAVRKGLIGPGEQESEGAMNRPVNMIISAPTSSGKSFCAEIAAAKALANRQRVVLLFPLKALAEQTYARFKETYTPLGIRCLIVTGDHPDNDRPFASGDYDIAICIYEKFDLLLTRSLDLLKTIGLVVVDEIQTIGEPDRGALLERLLTKLNASIYHPALLALSAVIGDNSASAGKLAEWLNADLVEEHCRPVELYRGVAAEGTYKYRGYNSGNDSFEPFPFTGGYDNRFERFIDHVKTEPGQSLVFLKSRLETVDCAVRLASAVNYPSATNAIDALENEEQSFLIRSLRQALSRGVAFHNADLSSEQRHIVEQAFVNKEITVLFSTTTLAMGVNLNASTVYLETVKYTSGRYTDKPTLVPVSRAEFDNMTGRAGRFHAGNGNPAGRAIILANSEFDRDILWEQYINSEPAEQLRSSFTSLPLEDWLLDMISAGLLKEKSYEGFVTLLGKSFYGAVENGRVDPGQYQTALTQLFELGLVRLDSNDMLLVTPIGETAAATGLSVKTVGRYLDLLRANRPESAVGWLALVLSDPDIGLPSSLLNRWEYRSHLPLKMLAQCEYIHAAETKPLLGDNFSHQPLPFSSALALKALLLIEQWRQLLPVRQLEERFRIHLGQVTHIAESVAYRLGALGALLSAVERETPAVRQLNNLAFSVRYGLPADVKDLHRAFGDILNRSDFDRLRQAGIKSPGELVSQAEESWHTLLSSKDKILKIKEKIAKLKEEVHMEPRAHSSQGNVGQIHPAIFLEPEMIEIDGTYERERYLVKINGFPVRLTGKSFKYFTKLAWSRLRGESGWIYKEDIERGFNQARYLYRMKGEIAQGLNADWPIFENNRLGYYRLNADPSKIKINIDNLKDHPDYELRELVATGGHGPVN